MKEIPNPHEVSTLLQTAYPAHNLIVKENIIAFQIKATDQTAVSKYLNFLQASTGVEDIPLCFETFAIKPSQSDPNIRIVSIPCKNTVSAVLELLVSMEIISQTMRAEVDPTGAAAAQTTASAAPTAKK